MKTNQILERPMGEFNVLQRTQDGYFDANVLLAQWNSQKGNPKRELKRFLDSPSVKQFIGTIIEEEFKDIQLPDYHPIANMRLGDNQQSSNLTNGDYQVFKTIKGRNTSKGKTKDQVWMHPLLFIDFAMWINPKFKYHVLKFVYDQLIESRIEAGSEYREMCSAIKSICKPLESPQIVIKKVAEGINYIIYNHHEKQMRNKKAEESSMKELVQLQREVTKLIHKGFITSAENLLSYLRNEWREKQNKNIPHSLKPL
ncbi:KilA-N domain-containing protein [Myroides odoratimimus]|uniref:KilA-N domain-containing protein n=1 Tax=Myroides odoratimimus TaxID=76832 RepID=UPI002574F656|nr:KilA-N domain-containing protein [Myroides odoratimimus]MDM1494957.1 KilA-N domain-containing protein [Myroides odoratimimus]